MSAVTATTDQLTTKEASFSPLKVAFFSSLGQWMVDMTLYPIDTISTKIKSHTEQFLSFKEGYKRIVNKNGHRGLFNGFSTTFPCSFVPCMIYFVAYEQMNSFGIRKIKELEGNESLQTKLKLTMPLITAMLSEIACLASYMPFDVVRVRLQTNNDSYAYSSIRQGLREVVQKEGLLRLYKASHIYIATTTLQTGLFFWFFEMQRYFFLSNSIGKLKAQDAEAGEKDEVHKLPILHNVLLSLTSSVMSCLLVNPLDLILTRFQVTDSSKNQLSVRTLAKDLIKNEGYKAFFKGLSPRLAISCINSVIVMPIYEHFKAYYGADIVD